MTGGQRKLAVRMDFLRKRGFYQFPILVQE